MHLFTKACVNRANLLRIARSLPRGGKVKVKNLYGEQVTVYAQPSYSIHRKEVWATALAS